MWLCRSQGGEAKSPMQRYVQAVLSSDDFDKDVFDMEHFVVHDSSAHSLNHNTYHACACQHTLRMHNACRNFLQTSSFVLLYANTHNNALATYKQVHNGVCLA